MSEDEIGRAAMERAWREFNKGRAVGLVPRWTPKDAFQAGYEARQAEVAALTAQVAALEAERAGLREAVGLAVRETLDALRAAWLSQDGQLDVGMQLFEQRVRTFAGMNAANRIAITLIALEVLATDPARATPDRGRMSLEYIEHETEWCRQRGWDAGTELGHIAKRLYLEIQSLRAVTDPARGEAPRPRGREWCRFAGPGRGDCEHFIGVPPVLDETTCDEYGIPFDWCDYCWLAHKNQLLADEVENPARWVVDG